MECNDNVAANNFLHLTGFTLRCKPSGEKDVVFQGLEKNEG